MFFSLVFHFFFLSSCFSLQKTHTTTFHQNSARVITKITQKDCHHHPPLLKTQTTTKQPTTANTKSQKKALHHSLPPLTKPTPSNPPPLTKTRKNPHTNRQAIHQFNTETQTIQHQNSKQQLSKQTPIQTNKHNHQFNIDSNKHQ